MNGIVLIAIIVHMDFPYLANTAGIQEQYEVLQILYG
jgi:hypothetical protein